MEELVLKHLDSVACFIDVIFIFAICHTIYYHTNGTNDSLVNNINLHA